MLAQVDAAVGGKTGVNLTCGKNLLGSFHQPLAVIIDPGVLDTLPEREYRAGLFEIIKHGVIADADLFWLMSREPQRVMSHAPDVVDLSLIHISHETTSAISSARLTVSL